MLRYLKLKFLIEFKNEAKLPIYKGSILRGSLGKSLKRITCALKHKDCNRCILALNCCYYIIFESKKLNSHNKSPDRPPPFVLEVFDMEKAKFLSCDKMDFNIILIEDGIRWFSHIVYGVMNMGNIGIGFGVKDGFGKFQLISVKHKDKELFDRHSGKLIIPKDVDFLDLKEEKNEISKITINFITPYRVKHKNKLVDSFDFSIFIRSCLRRISQLEDTYLGKEPELDYKGFVRKAEKVKIEKETKRWFEIRRYSFRQHSKMKLGGLIGSATYTGDLKDFYPIIKYCEVVHVGKQTSFGFGKYEVKIE